MPLPNLVLVEGFRIWLPVGRIVVVPNAGTRIRAIRPQPFNAAPLLAPES